MTVFWIFLIGTLTAFLCNSLLLGSNLSAAADTWARLAHRPRHVAPTSGSAEENKVCVN